MVAIQRYVDVNVFIYWLGAHPKLGERSLKWIKDIETSHKKYVTSSLTIYELTVILSSLTGKDLRDVRFVEEEVDAILSLRGLAIEPLVGQDLLQAPSLMKRYGLDYEDSLHLATALRVGAEEIVTNDEDFNKAPLRRVF